MSKKRPFTTQIIHGYARYPDNPEEDIIAFSKILENEINKILMDHPRWKFKGIINLDLINADISNAVLLGQVKAIVLFERGKKRKRKYEKICVREEYDTNATPEALIEKIISNDNKIKFHSMNYVYKGINPEYGTVEQYYLFFTKKE